MATCEMCGYNREVVDAIVEGATMSVCLECSKFGHVIPINQPVVDKKIERADESIKPQLDSVDVIVDNYNDRIKKAREKKGLKQEDLAKAIAERVSVIHQLESKKLKPSFKLSKKLSVFLNIDLITSSEQKNPAKPKDVDFKDNSLTIGDMLKSDEEE
ncbi:TIGR00270 family protein [archaeon]|jgi:putative transcription factor|nr:TIGR00270 family protein [archaeon]